jgi:hypothetical protein
MNLDYNPTEAGKRQKAVYGTNKATRKARDQWLQHAVDVIYSEHQSEAGRAYRHFARSKGLHEELARAILIHDILVSILLQALQ